MNQMNLNEEEIVFGLDIGTRNVVGMVGYKKDERFVVAAQEIRQHQTRAMLDGQIHDINRVAATIADIRKALQEKTGLKLDEVCIAAAGRVLKTMNVHVDMELDKERNVTKEDISALVSIGVEQAFADFQEKNDTDIHFYCVGYSVVRYFLNGLWMGQPEHHKAKNIGADMIATFLPDDVVDGLYSAVELAGLKVANLTLEPIAAIRVAIPEKFRLLNIAMIDVGAGTSDISITNDGSVVAFGMLPYAGDSLTELLAKTCLIDFTTAEQIKTAALHHDKIVYEDIMGMEQTITADEVVAICQPEIDKMSKLTADTIRELNGGTSPSAVFIVGGGGKIKGFDAKVAEELGLDPKRVAIRGEEIMGDVEFPDGALKDSTIITPVGICLTYYEQNNNFIYITFNGNRIKLYDNNKLTVMDAAMQAAFTREALFPRRGKELHYTVNGKNCVARGEYGESAHVYVNDEEVNLNYNIQANDVITLKESTLGAPAQEKIADLADYNGKITLTINGDEVHITKPVRVNGAMVTEEYAIQDGDEIELTQAYTYDGFFEFMGLSAEDMILYVNGKKAESDVMIHDSDKLEIKSKRELELKEIYRAAQLEASKGAYRAASAGGHASRAGESGKTESLKTEEQKAGNLKPEDLKAEATEPEASKPETQKAEAAQAETVKAESLKPEASQIESSKPEAQRAEAFRTEEQKAGKAETGKNETEAETAAEPETASAEATKAEPQKEAVLESRTEAEASQQETVPDAGDKKGHAAKQDDGETEEAEDAGKKIIVIVNQKPIVMRGKENYTFVDIFDYIDFDTSRMRGSGIATLVNGKDAQYTQELYNGDKIEVYWK
ncbi:MAG: rod shape-determining protein [Lachnospiraceae bacterium]|nr:rod shape-determining protein [Lachnospiraceae bacterium]